MRLGKEPAQHDRSGPGLSQRVLFRVALSVFLVTVLFWPLSPAAAQFGPGAMGQVTEYDIKRAYLYNFTRYFSWPDEAFANAKAPFVIGVLGNDPFGDRLDEVARTKTFQGRRIEIKRFPSLKDYKPCQLLFIPRTVARETAMKAVTQTQGKPVLLVGETPGFATSGGTVNFYPDPNGTIGFEINVDATRSHGLGVDARLLKLAKIVRTAPITQETRAGN